VKGTANSVDFGDRMYDPRLGRWLSIDSQFNKYPAYSPYNFAVNSPINVVDADGNDIYLIAKATSEKNLGHIVIAVDNYKQREADVYDAAGNITGHKGDYIPEGTVTVYSFGPEDAEAIGKLSTDKDVDGHVSGTTAKKEDVLAGRIKAKGSQFDGVAVIKTDKATDDASKGKLDKIRDDVNSKKLNIMLRKTIVQTWQQMLLMTWRTLKM